MRIAVFHNVPPSGLLRTVYLVASGLANRGHTLDLYTTRVPDREFYPLESIMRKTEVHPFSVAPLFDFDLDDVFTVCVHFRDRPTTLWRLERLHRELAAKINAEDYDAAVAFGCMITYAPYLLRYLHIPAIYYCAEPPRALYESIPTRPGAGKPTSKANRLRAFLGDVYYAGYLRKLRQIDIRNTQAADLVVADSYYTRESVYRAYGLNAQVIYAGVDAATFRPTGVPRGDFVLSVGALHPLKAHDFVIESLSLIEPSIRPRLSIVSHMTDETERNYLVDLARKRRVELRFHHNVPGDELVRLYSTALVTACGAIMEPFGLTPLESMACETPVVAVKEGGYRETVVDGESGYLVDRDPQQFADAIARLIVDHSLRVDLGHRARRIAEQWSWERCVDRWEHYLIAVCTGA